MIIGILALQGAFIEHKIKLNQLHINSFYIRNKDDLLQKKDGLIIPGGESTAIYKLLKELDMIDLLVEQINEGLPTFGTCAGLILLAKKITGQDEAFLKVLDVTVTRNAYGRQLSSFITNDLFDNKKIEMIFIRAPYIPDASSEVEVLSIVDENIVGVRQKHILGVAFHPELSKSLIVHKYFVQMIKEKSEVV